MKKINIGIIGFGKMGKIRYAQLKKFKDLNIICIFDKNEKIVKKNYPKIVFAKNSYCNLHK